MINESMVSGHLFVLYLRDLRKQRDIFSYLQYANYIYITKLFWYKSYFVESLYTNSSFIIWYFSDIWIWSDTLIRRWLRILNLLKKCQKWNYVSADALFPLLKERHYTEKEVMCVYV